VMSGAGHLLGGTGTLLGAIHAMERPVHPTKHRNLL
jgi:hypothetical protein